MMLMAESTGDLISVSALSKLLPVIFTGIALIVGKMWGRKQAESLKIEEPVPELPTRVRKGAYPPTWDQHEALERRVRTLERHHEELQEKQSQQFQLILLAGTERERRISDKLDEVAREWHRRLDEIFKPKTPRG